jgi:hypothetical protein
MNYKLIFLFIVYYLVVGSVYTFGGQYLGDSTTTAVIITPEEYEGYNVTGNETGYVAGATEESFTIWNAEQKVGSTLLFMFFGIGLPSDTPGWLQVMFFIVNTGITILAIAVIVGAIKGD